MPPVKYDMVLIVDLEASCYQGVWPADEVQEIIEIGIAEVSIPERRITRAESIVVKPLSSKISEYCTELTGWTQKAVDEGTTLLHACQTLQADYDSRNRLWVSQGNFDRKLFYKNCQMYGVPYPFGDHHLNISAMFSLLTGTYRQSGMKSQLSKLGMTLEGTHHSGVDDAKNIARIFLEVLKRGHIKV